MCARTPGTASGRSFRGKDRTLSNMRGSSDSNQEEGVFPSLSDSSHMTMSEHLSQTQFAAYSERALHPDALLAIDNHLASCDMCHERLTRMVVPGVAKIAVNQPF